MTGDVGAGDAYTFWSGAWDVHDSTRLCTAGGNSIQVDSMSGNRISLKQRSDHAVIALSVIDCGHCWTVACQPVMTSILTAGSVLSLIPAAASMHTVQGHPRRHSVTFATVPLMFRTYG